MEDRETEPTRPRISQNLLLVSLVPIGLFVVVFAFLFYRFGGAIEMKATPWTDMVKLLVLFVVAALSALGARALLTPILRAGRPEPAAADPNNLLRSRMAPFVLALGGSAIVLLTLTLIIAFAILASKSTVLQGKIDTLLLGIFGSVLPILATWVGTVIAFYFTNESFQQAMRATSEATSGLRAPGPKVPERMIPMEKIVKLSVERADARKVTMAEIDALMKPPVTRVVIFDKAGSPVFVIRRKLYPSDWTGPDGKPALEKRTVQDYLEGNGGANATDASRFGFVAPGATLEEARAVMRDTRAADVFVTLTGQKTEGALGWLTDDLLKSA